MAILDTRPIDLVIGKLEARGCRPGTTGPGEWRSRCPCHQGKSQNLSIKETDDGTVILNCHHTDGGRKTCTVPAIAAALGISMRDLFPSRVGPAPKKKTRPEAKGHADPEGAIAGIVRKLGAPTASWTYHDPERYDLMRVYRFDLPDGSKQFRPVHVDDKGWHLGDPPDPLPLFNLPELAAADTVIVVEGEKCCELVRSLGLVATTSAHGAKSPQKADWRPVAGKKVVIVPDRDGPGEAYAAAVATILHGLDPHADIRIIRLPGEPGDDIEQWLSDRVPDTWSPGDCAIELRRLWLGAPPWAPPPVDSDAEKPRPPDGPKLTEWGNAQRLIAGFGDRLRFCLTRGIWLEWDGRRWDACAKGAIWRWAKETVRHLAREAAEEPDAERRTSILRWALKSEQKKILGATIDLAWSELGVGITVDELDRDGWLLNCPNGTVDLKTGMLRPHSKDDLISKITRADFDPAAECPRWREALDVIFAGDRELIAYVQRALGYSLTGDISEHALFLCYGTGRNGKNTILDTVRGAILHDYATVASPRVFLSAGQGDHPAMLADLVGRRYVPTSEVDEGERLAESLVKRVTGDRSIKARFMHQNPFEFIVQFKLWMLANCKPEIHGLDEGIWSRIRVIPFDTFIPAEKRIPNLSDILVRDEGAGILGWLVQGCVEWAKGGLREPGRVKEASQAYRAEQDMFGEYLRQCCVCHLGNPALRETVRVSTADLYTKYTEWCKSMGEKNVLNGRKFATELTKRGYPLKPSNGIHYRFGIALTSAESGNNNESSGERAPY